jgi:hypothetical protein
VRGARAGDAAMSVFHSYKGTLTREIDGLTHVVLWGKLKGEYLETSFTVCDPLHGRAMHRDIMLDILRRVRHTPNIPTCIGCALMLSAR